ncbi:MAG: nitroreductase family protein [Dehalococcoidia bacterium]
MTDPGLFQTLYTTRALRRFKPDPIPDDVLFQVLDAGIRASSGQNAQDWRFLVITDPAVKAKLQEWALEGWARYQARFGTQEAIDALPRSQRLSLNSVRDLSHTIGKVPVVLGVLGLKGRHSTPGGSVFPAVQNIQIAARALGLGSSIFNLPFGHKDELLTMLNIPENNELYCLLPMGYPTDKQGPVKRKPLRDVVYWEKFGERWPFAEQQPATGYQDKWVPPQS